MGKIKFYAFALLITGLLFSYGCKKEDGGDDNGGGGDNPSGSDYRVKESISSEDNVETDKDVFTYDGEKISSVLSYVSPGKTEWETDSKSEITYPDANSFEMLTSDYNGGNWALAEKEVVTLQDGLWQTDMNYIYSGTDWVPDYKTEYSYNSGKIVKEEEFYYDGGEMMNQTKILYSWAGDAPSTAENYSWEDGDWVLTTKDTLSVTNGKIVEIKQFDYESGQYFMKMELQYIGDAISSIVFSVSFGGIWTEAGTFLFTYDGNGNLTKQEITGAFASSTTYTYEEGKGNASLFAPNTGWFNLILPLKSGAKSATGFQDMRKIYSTFLSK